MESNGFRTGFESKQKWHSCCCLKMTIMCCIVYTILFLNILLNKIWIFSWLCNWGGDSWEKPGSSRLFRHVVKTPRVPPCCGHGVHYLTPVPHFLHFHQQRRASDCYLSVSSSLVPSVGRSVTSVDGLTYDSPLVLFHLPRPRQSWCSRRLWGWCCPWLQQTGALAR